MEGTAEAADAVVMKKAIRVISVVASSLLAVAALWLAFVFGDCAGWKGTGTCPRVPLWDWEVFNIVFVGTAPLGAAIRVRPGRFLWALAEAIVAAAIAGAVVVVATAA